MTNMTAAKCPINDVCDCRICYDPIHKRAELGVVFPCGHTGFHAKCLQAWRKACHGTCRCPCCNCGITKLYMYRLVPATEDLEKRPVYFPQKIKWTTQHYMPFWYELYALVTAVWLAYFLWDLFNTESVKNEIEVASLGLVASTTFMTMLHLPCATLLYDYRHNSLTGWQLVTVLTIPWFVFGSIAALGTWGIQVAMVAVFVVGALVVGAFGSK